MGRGKRRKMRELLRNYHGDRCWWCGGKMDFPKKGDMPKKLGNMATIEHYRAKRRGTGDNPIFLNLAHMKCNR